MYWLRKTQIRRNAQWLCALAVLLVSTITSLRAADTGAISGAIFDPSGAPIADAIIRAREVSTGEGLILFPDALFEADFSVIHQSECSSPAPGSFENGYWL